MDRRITALPVLAAVLASCGGPDGTELFIQVANGFGEQHYRLTCDPASGDVPRPAELCRLLAEKADVMLFRSKDKSTCAGGVTTVHLEAHGVFKGKSVDATEIDACQANPEAERLWLSELPPPPSPP
jgi:hypothetical protein